MNLHLKPIFRPGEDAKDYSPQDAVRDWLHDSRHFECMATGNLFTLGDTKTLLEEGYKAIQFHVSHAGGPSCREYFYDNKGRYTFFARAGGIADERFAFMTQAVVDNGFYRPEKLYSYSSRKANAPKTVTLYEEGDPQWAEATRKYCK